MKSIIRSGLPLLLLGLCAPSAATLGEDVESVRVDQAQLEAALEVTGAAGFSVHLMRLPSGTVVKEYVSPSGIVFAISWQGPTLPDLRQVLGRYFEQYVATVRSPDIGSGSRRTQSTQGSGLVVQSGGHMRAFFGRAYLTQLLPRGVLPEEIQ